MIISFSNYYSMEAYIVLKGMTLLVKEVYKNIIDNFNFIYLKQ